MLVEVWSLEDGAGRLRGFGAGLVTGRRTGVEHTTGSGGADDG